MIMFLLFFLLASLLVYEETTNKEDNKGEEEFQNVLEDMIKQLHTSHLEIMKNKSNSLVLLRSMSKLIKSIQTGYEEKLARWDNELNKLRTLNESIEAQIRQCKEAVFPDSFSKGFPDENGFSNLTKLGNSDPGRNGKKLNKVPEKKFDGENVDKMFSMEQNTMPGEQEPTLFDLEKEIMSSPILRDIMEIGKEDQPLFCDGLSTQRKEAFQNPSTFRIYEFFNQDHSYPTETEPDCKNLLGSKHQEYSNVKNSTSIYKSDLQQPGDTELLKYIKSNCPTLISNPFSLTNCLPTLKCDLNLSGEQPTINPPCPTSMKRVRFGEPNLKISCHKNSEMNYNECKNGSVQSLSWYCGPTLQKNTEVDKPIPRMFEYKLKQPRTRDQGPREPFDVQSCCNGWPGNASGSRLQNTFDQQQLGRVEHNCDLESIEFESCESMTNLKTN